MNAELIERSDMTFGHVYPQELQDAIDAFNNEAHQLVSAFASTPEMQATPPIVYHYTNDVGLRGILETGKLWLTDIFDLNDPSELRHGFSLGLETLKSLVASGPAESRAFAADLTAFIDLIGLHKIGHFFVCSLSSCGDDLGQWRSYADNGRGYALGFDTAVLEAGFVQNPSAHSHAATFPVTYNDAKLADLQRLIAEKMIALPSMPHGRGLSENAIKGFQAALTVHFVTHVIHASLHFKHEAYSNEREYRFVETYPAGGQPVNMKLRSRPYSIVKYEEFDWRCTAGHALKEIVVGPASDKLKAAQFAADCLQMFHHGSVQITNSPIPYRAI
jgi:hypothetical protein